MFVNQKNIHYKTNFTELKKTSIDDLVSFLKNCLISFPQEFKNKFQTYNYIDERRVSPFFSKFLEYNSRILNKPYIFTHQSPEFGKTNKIGKDREVDIDIILYANDYFESKPFFVIECKWLRLPPSKSKQYVSGNIGGIERFKKELHGRGLKYSAMIGFIEKESFEYWFKTINAWITELFKTSNESITWGKLDLLKEMLILEKIATYISENKRENDYIMIYHLWIQIFLKNNTKAIN